jgi:hypothetical protein
MGEHFLYVNTRTAGDIAITAAEGGIGYWSQIKEYNPSRWTDGASLYTSRVPRNFVFYVLGEYDEDTGFYDYSKPLAVTPEVIQRGVNLFMNGTQGPTKRGVQFIGRPFADMSDLSAMDADEADCVIQLGLFGELVYG